MPHCLTQVLETVTSELETRIVNFANCFDPPVIEKRMRTLTKILVNLTHFMNLLLSHKNTQIEESNCKFRKINFSHQYFQFNGKKAIFAIKMGNINVKNEFF